MTGRFVLVLLAFAFGAKVRQRCGRSLSPLSSMKTIIRPSVQMATREEVLHQFYGQRIFAI
jgi:hypothetical protein